MAEQLTDAIGSEFIPVIFDQNDTEFVLQATDICGFRYKELSRLMPVVEEGGKLELTDESTAVFVKNCLLRRAELAESLMVAHHLGIQRNHEYRLPRLSVEQQQRIHDSIERSRAVSETARLLVLIVDTSLEG